MFCSVQHKAMKSHLQFLISSGLIRATAPEQKCISLIKSNHHYRNCIFRFIFPRVGSRKYAAASARNFFWAASSALPHPAPILWSSLFLSSLQLWYFLLDYTGCLRSFLWRRVHSIAMQVICIYTRRGPSSLIIPALSHRSHDVCIVLLVKCVKLRCVSPRARWKCKRIYIEVAPAFIYILEMFCVGCLRANWKLSHSSI